MASIKAQKVRYGADGNIVSGSAAIIDTIYVSTGQKNHSRKETREKLGKVLYLSDDKRSGIFLSPTRGLVEYDADEDTFNEVDRDDSRINTEKVFPEPEVHTVFGDSYLLLEFLEKAGMLSVLRSVFPKKEAYERVLCHILHGVLKDGSRISCDNFIMKSFASYVFTDVPESTLRSDTRFFSLMGEDGTRMAFFKSFVSYMQKLDPSFGKGCYVDSTPLPNSIENNPFNALCCHGVNSSEVMIRLILVLDEKTGLPVWFDIIPGNILDINTVMKVVNDVADSLGIEIDSLVLDAGYTSEELLGTFHNGTEKTLITKMPARRGYPYKTLYHQIKDLIGKGKYAFVRRHHTYFGKRIEIELFGHEIYAYVYVDRTMALHWFSDYLLEHQEEYDAMKLAEKDWMTVKNGYFVLLSNIDTTPADLLTMYFGRTEIETVFKTSKEYLELLPLSKWTDLTVRGKILHDIIDTIIFLMLQKKLKKPGISISELLGKTQSLMCRKSKGQIHVETPNKQVRQYYSYLGMKAPAHIKLTSYTERIYGPKM